MINKKLLHHISWISIMSLVGVTSFLGCNSAIDDDIRSNLNDNESVSISLEPTPTMSINDMISPTLSYAPTPTVETTEVEKNDKVDNEEEERKKAEEEAKKAEEEAKKAEEEAKKAEEERKKTEEAKKAEEARIAMQNNSFSMMYYLAITAENIRISKNNRVILDEIYTSLLNDINPGAVDDITLEHLRHLRDIINSFNKVNTKRERLQFIYNQNKAAAIRSAVPNPIAILSVTNSLDWKKLAMTVLYTAVDSYTSYKNANASADMEYLISGWELDDEENDALQKNRGAAFDYMVKMVQKYDLDGKRTLNEKDIQKFSEICEIQSVYERIQRLNSEVETYKLVGSYWLELIDCYFEASKYKECLECIESYNSLSSGIFRKDYNYAKGLPKIIVAAQYEYKGIKYEEKISGYVKDLLDNTDNSKEYWSIRLFAAEVYMDLFSKYQKQEYLNEAYNIALDNVTVLLEDQRKLNQTYLNEVENVVVEEPDYRYLTEKEEKEKKEQYKAEKKQAEAYNKALKNARKTELPSIYEPLVVNCELLFSLANQLNISGEEKIKIENILQTNSYGTFITQPINWFYSFEKYTFWYDASMTKKEIIIPVRALTEKTKITVRVTANGTNYYFDDCIVKKVVRSANDFKSYFNDYYAHIESEKLKDFTWSKDAKIQIILKYEDVYDKEISLDFRVSEYKSSILGDKVVFEKE